MVSTDADTTSSSVDIPPSPYISLTPFLSPSSSSSPASYTSFTSPVTRHRYFASIAGLSVLLFDDSLALLDAVDLSPHIVPSLLSPSTPVHLHSLAISPSQQLAVSTPTHVHIFTLVIHQQLPPGSVDTSSAVTEAITSRLVVGGEEEEDTVHGYNPSLPHSFVCSYFTSFPTPQAASTLTWRPVSPYHLAELVVGGGGWVSIWRYDKESKIYLQTWAHTEADPALFSSPSPPRQAASQPSSPVSPQPKAETLLSLTARAALSQDSRVLVLLNHHPSLSLQLFNLDSVTRHPFSLAHPAPLLSFAFCPSVPLHENLLYTLCTDGVIRFWRQNRIKPSTTVSLSHLSPLTPTVVSDKGMSHSVSVEFGAGGKLGVDGGLVHTQSVPQSLSALKRKGKGEDDTDPGDDEEPKVPREVILEPEVLQDQADVDWYVCSELELTGSTSSAQTARNGYLSCMWVAEALKDRSLMAAVVSAATTANLSHFLQQSTAATAALPASLTSSYTAGLWAQPPSPAPRLLTVDREGTIQLWYMRDILSTPRTNCTPIPLVTLYHQLPAVYLHPWLNSVNEVLPTVMDEGVQDLVVKAWTGMEDGVCMRLTLVVKREEEKPANDKKLRGWKATFQIDRVIGGHHRFPADLPTDLTASPSSRHVASRVEGQVVVWACDESHLLLPRPGGDVEYGQQLVATGCGGMVWVDGRLVCVEDEWVDVWGWSDTRREWVRQGRCELDKEEGPVLMVDAVPALTSAYSQQHFVVVCTATAVTLFAVSPTTTDPTTVAVLQSFKLPAEHSPSPLTAAVLLPAPATSDDERLLLAYGAEDGGVTLVSLTPTSSSLSILTHFTAHSSTVVSIKAHSLCHLLTQSADDDVSIWECVSHIFSYQLLYTLPPPTAPVKAAVSSYFSEHAVTAVRSSTSPSPSFAVKKEDRKWRRCVDVVDAGDGQVHVVTGDTYGQLTVYRPSPSGWAVDTSIPYPAGYSLLSLVYSPHTLGVVVLAFEGGRQLPLLRHLHLSTLLPSTSSHLPIYHPLILEEDVMRGGLVRVKNVLADLVEQLDRPGGDGVAVKATNVDIAHLLLKEDRTAADEGAKASQPIASTSDSGQVNMSSFGGGFGGFGGGGGFGSFGAQPAGSTSSSLTPAITTYKRPTAAVQADPSSRELEGLAKALKTKRLPHLSEADHAELAMVVFAVAVIVEQEKQLDEFAQRYIFAASLYRLRNPYPVVQEAEDDKTAPPPYATLLVALPSIPTHAAAFAFHSSSIETLISLTTGAQAPLPPTGLSWEVCKQLGVGYWLRGLDLSVVMESVARAQYVVNKVRIHSHSVSS